MRLLLAEDEKELSNALVAILNHNQYTVDAVHDGASALDRGLTESYSGIILDIMMPGMNGLEVLRNLRAHGVTVPVLMLTAKAEVDDRITGLDAGADDYLTKPFAMGELLARIRAMTRRQSDFIPDVLRYGNIRLIRPNFELASDKASFRLGNREFQMIEMLMSNPNRLITPAQFLERAWGGADAGENAVWIYISYLRKKLEALESTVCITEAGGYRLEEKT